MQRASKMGWISFTKLTEADALLAVDASVAAGDSVAAVTSEVDVGDSVAVGSSVGWVTAWVAAAGSVAGRDVCPPQAESARVIISAVMSKVCLFMVILCCVDDINPPKFTISVEERDVEIVWFSLDGH
jgi:hypothetical protein